MKQSILENSEIAIKKENLINENSESPTSILSLNSPVNDLSFSISQLSLTNDKSSSSMKTQVVFDVQETEIKNPKPLPIPLYTESIWEVKSPTPSRTPMVLNKFLGENCSSSLPDFGDNSFTPQEREKGGVTDQDSIFNNGLAEDYNFLMFATNPEGSRKLQEMILSGHSSFIAVVLKRVTSNYSEIPLIYSLIIDQYGYHVCSKLIDYCNEQQLGLIVLLVAKNEEVFINISNNLNGAKVLKKLIKFLKGSPQINWLIARLCLAFNQLMTNQTGSYVINFCLDNLDVKQSQVLYKNAISQCLVLATHTIGCVSLNYFIDKIQGPHRQELLQLISSNAVFLSQDPSGNHVVQKVLDLENPLFSGLIGSLLRDHYVKLSLQKWGSHVVEKCLKSMPAMNYAVEELLSCSSSQLLQVARDQYGNYVVQKALNVTKKRNNTLYGKLLRNLQPHLSVLQFGYGKNVRNLVLNGLTSFYPETP